MLPIIKLFSISVKLFTKPILSRAKTQVYKSKNQSLKFLLVRMGNRIHQVEFWINRRFLNIHSNVKRVPKITDDSAFDKANEFLLEIVVLYGILGYMAISEAINSIQKSKELKQHLKQLDDQAEKNCLDLNQLQNNIQEDNHQQKHILQTIQKDIQAQKQQENQIIKELTQKTIQQEATIIELQRQINIIQSQIKSNI